MSNLSNIFLKWKT